MKLTRKQKRHRSEAAAQLGFSLALGPRKPTRKQQLFFQQRGGIPGVNFRFHERAEVISGDLAPTSCQIMELAELADDPLYLVELYSGYDALIRQSCLGHYL